jgi:hypothetical protein
MAYISQNFGLSTPPNFGIIEGWVFRDINANDKFDRDEPGAEGVTLYLEDKRETVTDSQGYFKFPKVVPGTQKIHLDLGSLSSELTAKDTEKQIKVKAWKEGIVTFALVRASSIKGRVFIDENSDLVFQDTEEPLEDVAIILLPGEQIRRTNAEGDFKFDNLLPGKYKVRIKSEDIPVGYELVSNEEIELELSAGKEIKDINFVVHLRSTTIKKF